jgi:hypothetical protein
MGKDGNMIRSLIKHITLVWSLLILVAFFGCRKSDHYFVSGLLFDPKQGIEIEKAKVEVWTQQLKSGVFEANFKLAGEQLTGRDGLFGFELESEKYTAVKLKFSKGGYYGLEIQVNPENLLQDDGYYAEYEMLPEAWIKFHIVNNEPFDTNDFFEYRLLNANISCEDCCTEDRLQFFGLEVNQYFFCKALGHHDLIVQWTKRKDKQQIYKTESFFIKAFDTTLIELYY